MNPANQNSVSRKWAGLKKHSQSNLTTVGEHYMSACLYFNVSELSLVHESVCEHQKQGYLGWLVTSRKSPRTFARGKCVRVKPP